MAELKLADLLTALVLGTILVSGLVIFIVVFILRYHHKQRAFQKDAAAFMRTKVEIQEETMTTVSRELHDNIGQLASLIKLQLGLLSDENGEQAKIAEIKTYQNELIAQVRSLSVSLKSENLDRFGLVALMQKDLERYRRISTFEIKAIWPDDWTEPDRQTATFLYRIFQEIMNNCVKHSEASLIQLHLLVQNGLLTLKVTDNGKGFEPEKIAYGSGLINLKERCEIIQAELKIDIAGIES